MFYRYFQFWNIAYSAYNKAVRGRGTLPESVYWLTNACGQPIPRPETWSMRRKGEGYFGKGISVLEKDISTLQDPLNLWLNTTGEADKPDLIFGGPPCQAFSQAGKQKGLQDDRGKMIYEFLRFVEHLRPPFFVMENVPNLKGIAGSQLYEEILQKMANLGYQVSVGILLAADFGTPQLRRRLFFVGCLKEIGSVSLPLPTHTPVPELFGLLPYVTVGKAFADLPEAEFSR